MLQISQNIKRARVEAKKTQQEVADYLDINRSTYAHWEKSVVPDIVNLQVLANYFGVTLTFLTNGHEFVEPISTIKEQPAQYESRLQNDLSMVNEPKTGVMDSITSLAKSAMLLADSNKILANNNQDLIQIMKLLLPISSGGEKGNQPKESGLREFLDKVADAGVGDLWSSKDEGLLKLGKFLFSDVHAKKE